MVSIKIPVYEFSGHYYPEVLEDLIQYLRDQGMDIDESPEEPFIQIERSIALGTHINNVLLDLVANEMYLPTAKLRESVRNLLLLIGYRLSQATPGSATTVCKLASYLAATTLLVDAPAVFSTRASADALPVEYEAVDDFTTERTDQLSMCFAYDKSLNVWTDHTANANGAVGWSPNWFAGADVGDLLLFGHKNIAWDKLRIILTAASVGTEGKWEYYDGTWDDAAPTGVAILGAGLRVKLEGLLGTTDNTGLTVRVRCNATGVYENCLVFMSGGLPYVDTTSFLGQTVVSTTASDYTVGRDWKPLPSLTDATSEFTAAPGTHDVDYSLPKDSTNWWSLYTYGTSDYYIMRFRVTVAGTLPTLTTCTIHNGGQYAFVDVTQGRTRQDNPLASSTGLANQSYELSRYPVIDDDTIQVFVDEAGIEEEWERILSLTSASPTDKVYVLDFDSDSRCTVKFGDSVNGKIPLAGIDNLRAVYRTMESQDGNVGANTIIVNRGSVPYFSSVTNPRKAQGWAVREGDDETGLERAKLLGPESLKTLGRATSAPDAVTLTEAYTNSEGSKLFSRCEAFEGSYGPKTVELCVVKLGGEFATVDELTELEEYFNGSTADKTSRIIVFNQRAVVTNHVAKAIDVTATVYGGDKTAVEAAIRTLLQPEAKVINEDGTESIDWLWDFGEEVPTSMIIKAIMESQPSPRKVTLTLPAADVALTSRELPHTGVLTITIVP